MTIALPRLRFVREQRLVTIRELALAAGVSTNTIVRLEKGLPAEFRTVKKLAAALGVEPRELMRETEEAPQGQQAAAA